MAVPSKAKVCGRSIARVAGSNPAAPMDFFLLCVVKVAASRRADHSFRRFLQGVCVFVCLIVCDLEA